MEPYFSIIIPVYNVETYLVRCFESVQKQSFFDFEVIMVDDGSTDHSALLCKKFMKEQPNWHLISQNNRGLAGARNAGLNAAKGKYIVFLDADDYLDKDYLSKVFVKMEEDGYDVCSYAVRRIDEDSNYLYDMHFHEMVESCDFTVTDREDFLCNFFLQYKVGWEAWLHVYRRELIERSSLRFCEHTKFAEDIAFTFGYLLYADNYFKMTDVLYNYTERKGSLTDSYGKAGEWRQVIGQVIPNMMRQLQSTGYTKEQIRRYVAAFLEYQLPDFKQYISISEMNKIAEETANDEMIAELVKQETEQKEKMCRNRYCERRRN